jgi:hypothetical protein
MATAMERITTQQAYHPMRSEASAILVYAYDSKEQYQKNHLESAIDLEQFSSQADTIPKDQEVIFYCFTNTKALAGGAAT